MVPHLSDLLNLLHEALQVPGQRSPSITAFQEQVLAADAIEGTDAAGEEALRELASALDYVDPEDSVEAVALIERTLDLLR
jgi:hypothetical protein